MKELKIVEKAYKIDSEKVNEGYYLQGMHVYAENINKAKSKLLEKIKYDDYVLRFSGELITYLNIPVIRDPEYDKFEYVGNTFTKRQIKLMEEKEKRLEELDSFLNNKEIDFCYIRKGGYYYLPNSCGYTEYLAYAGVYRIEEGVSSAKMCNELRVIPIIDIETHNEMINEKINDLKSRLIIK